MQSFSKDFFLKATISSCRAKPVFSTSLLIIFSLHSSPFPYSKQVFVYICNANFSSNIFAKKVIFRHKITHHDLLAGVQRRAKSWKLESFWQNSLFSLHQINRSPFEVWFVSSWPEKKEKPSKIKLVSERPLKNSRGLYEKRMQTSQKVFVHHFCLAEGNVTKSQFFRQIFYLQTYGNFHPNINCSCLGISLKSWKFETKKRIFSSVFYLEWNSSSRRALSCCCCCCCCCCCWWWWCVFETSFRGFFWAFRVIFCKNGYINFCLLW